MDRGESEKILEIEENSRKLIKYIEFKYPTDVNSIEIVASARKNAKDVCEFWDLVSPIPSKYLMEFENYPEVNNNQKSGPPPITPSDRIVIGTGGGAGTGMGGGTGGGAGQLMPLPKSASIPSSSMTIAPKVPSKQEIVPIPRQNLQPPTMLTPAPSVQTPPSLSQHELNIINFDNWKNRLEKKIDHIRKTKNKDFKCDIGQCWDVLENGFQIYIRNLLDSLIKISAYENNLESLSDFQVTDETLPPHLRIFDEDENKKYLLKKLEDKTAKERNRVEVICGENWLEKYKTISKMEEQDQKDIEDLLQNKPFLDINSDKTSKKMKKGNEECNEFCKLLLKSKNEKDKELDQKKQSEEATQITLDRMTEKSKSSKLSKKYTEETVVQQKSTKEAKFNQSQKPIPVRQRITLKTLMFFLENNPLYRKSAILQAAYSKQS